VQEGGDLSGAVSGIAQGPELVELLLRPGHGPRLIRVAPLQLICGWSARCIKKLH
jgi:hypothetical protein